MSARDLIRQAIKPEECCGEDGTDGRKGGCGFLAEAGGGSSRERNLEAHLRLVHGEKPVREKRP